jgi:hypothetical protein
MSKTIKKMILQYSYLEIEKEEIEEKCADVEKEMREAMKKHHPDTFKEIYNNNKKKKVKNPTIAEGSEKKQKTPDTKKIYRKIVSKIHPDKSTGDEKIFKEAAEAYELNNIAKLLEISHRCNLKVTSLSDESLTLLANNITQVQKKIQSLKETTAWAWMLAKTEEEKIMVLNNIVIHIKEK